MYGRALSACFALTVIALLAAGIFDPRADAMPPDLPYTPPAAREIPAVVVRVARADRLDAAIADAERAGYAVVDRSDALPSFAVALAPGEDPQRAISAMMRVPGVLYAEPAHAIAASDIPADPLYSRQAAYLEPVNAPAAWDVEQGSPETVVAVLDTGVQTSHPDLAGRIWANPAEIPDNGADDDGNGCVDDVHGCAFVHFANAGCDEPTGGDIDDDAGHGTFVSGVIAANGDGRGIVGVARGATIMPVKVLDCDGSGTSLDLAQGMLYAANNGARVINVSLGGSADAEIVREAVRLATARGALVVAASGNTGVEGVSYPARYEEVLAVGAAAAANPDARADFSTSGPEVDVVAIGEGILGTLPVEFCRPDFVDCLETGEPYAIGDGTSFTAPQVSGLAALIFSQRPAATPAIVADVIRRTATPLPPGDRPTWAGAGRIDMLAALRPPVFRLGVPGTASNP